MYLVSGFALYPESSFFLFYSSVLAYGTLKAEKGNQHLTVFLARTKKYEWMGTDTIYIYMDF